MDDNIHKQRSSLNFKERYMKMKVENKISKKIEKSSTTSLQVLHFRKRDKQRTRKSCFIFNFCLLQPDRQKDGQNICRIDAHIRGMSTQKLRALYYIGEEKITFHPKPDRQTDRHTYRRTDISVYRVASLLTTIKFEGLFYL